MVEEIPVLIGVDCGKSGAAGGGSELAVAEGDELVPRDASVDCGYCTVLDGVTLTESDC